MPQLQSRTVLFVCTFNRVRSPMAAGLMRWLYGDKFNVNSCGLHAGEAVDPLAAVVMAEIGVDLAMHRPKRLDDLLGDKRFTEIVALSEEAWPRVEAVGDARVEHWPISDPAESEGSRENRLEAYRLARQALQDRILEHFGPRSR